MKMHFYFGRLFHSPAFVLAAVLLALSATAQKAVETPSPLAQKGAESSAPKPESRIDPKPKIIELIGGEVMFLGVDAEGDGLWRNAEGFGSWRTPGVIHPVQGKFSKNQVTPLKAESCDDGKPGKPAGFQIAVYYISTEQKVLTIGTTYREDGSVESPVVLTHGGNIPENRTSVLPIIGGKSALLLLNPSGPLPKFGGVYDSSNMIPSTTSSRQPGSKVRPDGFQAITRILTADGGVLSFAPTYRVDGTIDLPHASGSQGGEIKNRTQIVGLLGGVSALLLTDPKTEAPLLKGIYPNDQLHSSSGGILLTERYLTIEGEILNLDTLYDPMKPARFVGARLGDKPIQNRSQTIKLAGSRSTVFTADPHSTDGIPRFAGIHNTSICLSVSNSK